MNATYHTTGADIWWGASAKALQVEVDELVVGTFAYNMLDEDDFSYRDLCNIAGGPLYRITESTPDQQYRRAWNEVIRSASSAMHIRHGFRVTPGPRTSRPERDPSMHGKHRA